jgi:hypothetical protein
VSILRKKWLGPEVLGDFFSNASGHPAPEPNFDTFQNKNIFLDLLIEQAAKNFVLKSEAETCMPKHASVCIIHQQGDQMCF